MTPNRFNHRVWRLALVAISTLASLGLSAWLFPRGYQTAHRALSPRLQRLPHYPVLVRGTPHAASDGVYYSSPGSITRNYYWENPRGYFKSEPVDEARLRLQRHLWLDDLKLGQREVLREGDRCFDRVEVFSADRDRPWSVALKWNDELPIKQGDVVQVTAVARAEGVKLLAPSVIDLGATSQSLDYVESLDIDTSWKQHAWTFAPARNDTRVVLAFYLADDTVTLDLAEVEVTVNGAPAPCGYDRQRPYKQYVEMTCNGAGFRDEEFPLDAPEDVWKIAVLGDSCAFGFGVHHEDLLTTRLEALLNSMNDGARRHECMNFSVPGYSTSDERRLYQSVVAAYRPHVVLVVMCDNDYIPLAEVIANAGDPAAHAQYFSQFGGFQPCIDHLRLLADDVSAQGGRLAVVVFANDIRPSWDQLERLVFEELKVPRMSTRAGLERRGLLEQQRSFVLTLDAHPNELAHRAAAEDIAEFLAAEGLLSGDETAR